MGEGSDEKGKLERRRRMTKGSVERVKAREKGDTWGEGRKEKTEGDRQTPRDRQRPLPTRREAER